MKKTFAVLVLAAAAAHARDGGVSEMITREFTVQSSESAVCARSAYESDDGVLHCQVKIAESDMVEVPVSNDSFDVEAAQDGFTAALATFEAYPQGYKLSLEPRACGVRMAELIEDAFAQAAGRSLSAKFYQLR